MQALISRECSMTCTLESYTVCPIAQELFSIYTQCRNYIANIALFMHVINLISSFILIVITFTSMLYSCSLYYHIIYYSFGYLTY